MSQGTLIGGVGMFAVLVAVQSAVGVWLGGVVAPSGRELLVAAIASALVVLQLNGTSRRA